MYHRFHILLVLLSFLYTPAPLLLNFYVLFDFLFHFYSVYFIVLISNSYTEPHYCLHFFLTFFFFFPINSSALGGGEKLDLDWRSEATLYIPCMILADLNHNFLIMIERR